MVEATLQRNLLALTLLVVSLAGYNHPGMLASLTDPKNLVSFILYEVCLSSLLNVICVVLLCSLCDKVCSVPNRSLSISD